MPRKTSHELAREREDSYAIALREMMRAMLKLVVTMLVIVILTASPASGDDLSSFHFEKTNTIKLYVSPWDGDAYGLHVLLRMLEESYWRIVQEFGFYTLEAFTVILHLENDFPQRSARTIAFYSPATKTVHVHYRKPRSSLDTRRLEEIFTHELSHGFVDALAGSANCPHWFKEGIAKYVESAWMRNSRRAKAREQAREGTFPAFAASPYESGAVAIDYLMNSYGPLSVRQIIETMQHTDQTFAQAVVTVTGLDPSAFEQVVTEWLLRLR